MAEEPRKSTARRRPDMELTESTAALIARVRSGESAAREELVARYLPLLKRWAHGRLPAHARGIAETDDLVQITLLRAVSRLDDFRSQREGAFLAYLRKTLMNQLRNEIRRAAHERDETTLENIPDGRPSLLEQMIDREVLDAYEAALATLPETMQEAVILSVEFGYSHREVAAAIGSPSANAARMTVARALAKLSRAMDRPG